MNTAEITALNPGNDGTRNSTWRDWLGIGASVGCAIHCAAMPFVFAYLPALGLSFLADEAFHKWMALACFLIAIVAFIPGIRNHGNWLPISVGAIGLALITFAAFGLAGECCPTCEANAATNPDSTQVHAVSSDSDGTECEDCENFQSCSDAASESEIALSTPSHENNGLLSKMAPWITPFGGLLLVVAHLLNRRLGNLCACCATLKKA